MNTDNLHYITVTSPVCNCANINASANPYPCPVHNKLGGWIFKFDNSPTNITNLSVPKEYE